MLNRARAKQRAETAPLLTPRTTRQLHLVPPYKSRVLLICDSSAGTAKLKSALNLGAVEIVSVSHAEELIRVGEQDYVLAIIDVAPAKLLEVLKLLRASDRLAALPVLVEASGIIAEARFAGVLPQYRAMPCSYSELVALARQRLAPAKPPIREGKVL